MGLTVSEGGGGNFEPHPAGQFPARCIDVVDVGWKQTQYGPKNKLRLVFFCGQWTEKEIDGETKRLPMLAFANFTQTLHENGRLRPFLELWRDQPFTQAELEGFDMDHVLNAPAFVQISHNHADNGKTYANVKTIMRLPKGMEAPPTPSEYVRVQDREDWEGPIPHPDMRSFSNGEPVPEDTTDYAASEPDDDLPF